MSAMLRSDSEISPIEFASASSSAWRGVSSSVAVLPLGELLAVLGLDQLADGEHADVAEQRVGDEVLAAAAAAQALRMRMTSTWSLGRIRRPTPVSSLMRVEMARMPGGQDGGQHAALAGLDELHRGDRLAGSIGARAIAPVTERMPASPCSLVMNVGDGIGRPALPAEVDILGGGAERDVAARNENLG